MTIIIKDKSVFACDEVTLATELVPGFVKNALQSEWFDKLIAKCEAKANKKLNIDEILFVADYTVSLLEDAGKEYVSQTVDACGIADEIIPKGHPMWLALKCIDVKFSFSDNTTEFLHKCGKYLRKKLNWFETLLVLNYAIGFKSHEVDVDDLLKSMDEAGLG